MLTERAELPVTELTLRTVAGPPEVQRSATEGTTENRLVLDGHALATALARGTRELQHRFHDLGAEFAYPLAPLMNELRVQGGLLLVLADVLNMPDDRQGPQLDAPLRRRWAETRELFAEGCAKAAELLFPEALEWLRKAEDRYPTDFAIQFELGWTYLYGVSRDDSVFNPVEAELHLRRAVRYGQGAVRRRAEMAAPASEAMVHLSIACHLLGRTEDALGLCLEACKVNPNLSQAYYHRAKYAALLGHEDEAAAAVRSALQLDRRFALTLDSDRDLARVRTRLEQMLEELRNDARRLAEQAVSAGSELGGMKAEAAALKARLSGLQTRLRNVESLASVHPADYGEAPGISLEVRRAFDEDDRKACRALERLGRFADRAETALRESETTFERCRRMAAEDTLFALQDVLELASEATTPLRRAAANLTDAAEYARAGDEYIPRMEGQLVALASEAARNRTARRRSRVWELLSHTAGRLPGFVVAGALAGILVRIVIYLAAGQFLTLGFGRLLSASLVFGGLGAAAGAVVGAFGMTRLFRPVRK